MLVLVSLEFLLQQRGAAGEPVHVDDVEHELVLLPGGFSVMSAAAR